MWYDNLNWDDLVAQARQDHQSQWGSRDSFDPYSGGMTTINGKGAQIYLPNNTDLSGDAWDNVAFNLNNPDDPNQPQKHMTRLSRGADGKVQASYYDMNRAFPWQAAAVLAAPFAAAGLMGAGMGEAAAATAGGMGATDAAYLAAADAAGGLIPSAGAGGAAATGAGLSLAGLPEAAANLIKDPLTGKLISTAAGAIAGHDANNAAKDAAAIQRSAIEQEMALAKESQDWAREDRDTWRKTFLPLQDKMVSEAMTGFGPERYARESADAQGETMRQYGLAADRLARSTAPGAAMANGRLALASAAAGANAQTNARQRLQDLEYARKVDAMSLGKGLPANATAGLQNAASTAHAAGRASGAAADTARTNANTTAAAVGGMAQDIFSSWYKSNPPAYNHAAADPTYGAGRIITPEMNSDAYAL